MGIPQKRWFIRKNPNLKWMIGGYTYFRKPPYGGFHKWGVALNRPVQIGFFPYKPSSYWGTPISGTPICLPQYLVDLKPNYGCFGKSPAPKPLGFKPHVPHETCHLMVQDSICFTTLHSKSQTPRKQRNFQLVRSMYPLSLRSNCPKLSMGGTKHIS